MRIGIFLLACACVFSAARARAEVVRFAVIIGNERGASHDVPLRYAVSDASRVYDVLRDLGGFRPVNMVLLRNERADTVRDTLLSVNERIRALVSQPDTRALLFVYYSGHADAEQLHLGETSFAARELAQLARGSAADFRLVVLDACRSGAMTRVKGGDVVAPFALSVGETLPSDGLAFLTASSADESAQESDELRSSFFTHAFVSGLLGAADRDGNGSVVLEEVYSYAYQATLRATSRTFAGTQHPSFRYDFHGEGELVLTEIRANAQERASLRFPPDASFLLMRGSADGPVVAELSELATRRVLSLPPDRYFVRGRGADVLYESTLTTHPGTSVSIDLDAMRRIEYVHLVRKGGTPLTWTHGPVFGARVRSSLSNASTSCWGGFVGYGVDWRQLGARVRLSACTSSSPNEILAATANAYDVETRVHHAWDLWRVSFELGLGGGVSLLSQSFQPSGRAPARTALTPFLAVGVAGNIELAHGIYAGLDVAAETHLLRMRSGEDDPTRSKPDFAVRTSFALGKWF